jgi:hypothetical protein
MGVISEPCGIDSAIERNSELHNSYSSDGDRPLVVEDSTRKTLNASVYVPPTTIKYEILITALLGFFAIFFL